MVFVFGLVLATAQPTNNLTNEKGRYSRVPNKRTGRLFENDKKSHLYALIQTYIYVY